MALEDVVPENSHNWPVQRMCFRLSARRVSGQVVSRMGRSCVSLHGTSGSTGSTSGSERGELK